MSEELALDEFIKEDKKNQKKTVNPSNNNNNNHFKRNYNNNNNNNNGNGGNNRNFIKRTNNTNKSNDTNRPNNYQYNNNNKEDRFENRNDSNDRVSYVKKVSRPITKGRKDDNANDNNNNNNNNNRGQQTNQNTLARQLQINATKKVTIPKKLYTVRVRNLPSTINSHEIYELASEKEQVKVESISTTFNCTSDSKLIEAEISYYHQSDANTFVQNYNEATLEDQVLQVFML